MKLNKKKTFIYFLIISGIILVCTPLYLSKADPTTSSGDITAFLYDSPEQTNGIELTTDGATVNNWMYSTNRYLWVDPNVLDNGEVYKVRVEMPPEFYAPISEISTPANYTNAEFTKNVTDQEIYGSYKINDYSGTFEYTLEAGKTSGTIQIPITYDTNLWGGITYAKLTPDGVKPISVKLMKQDGTVIKEISIGKAFAGGDSRTMSSVLYFNDTFVHKSNTTPMTISPEQDAKITIGQWYSGTKYIGYFKELELTLQLPSYTDSENNVHYLNLQTEKLRIGGWRYNIAKGTLDTSRLESDGIVKFKSYNVFYEYGKDWLGYIYMNLPEELKDSSESSLTFKNGSIKLDGLTTSGNLYEEFFYRDINDIIYKLDKKENVEVGVLGNNVNIENRPVDVVSFLGGIQVVNKGTSDSGAKIINYNFDVDNTNDIHITTINILADKVQEYIDVEYSLIDEQGNNIYFDENGNIVAQENAVSNTWHYNLQNIHQTDNNFRNIYMKLTRKNLSIESHRNYYFKTIKYKLESITKGEYLYATDGTKSTKGAGNFYGKVNLNSNIKDKVITNITIEDENNLVEPINLQSTVSIIAGIQTAYSLSEPSASKSSIEAGDSTTITGLFSTIEYGSATWLNKIVIGFVLPTGVSVDEQEIFAFNPKQNRKITGLTLLEPVNLNNGTYLWKIKLPEDESIYLFNEELEEPEQGNTLQYSIKLNTDLSMNTTVVSLKDTVYIAGKNSNNITSGSLSWAMADDIYDLNENGLTNDHIGQVNPEYKGSFQINPRKVTIDLADSLQIVSNGAILPAGDNSIYTPDDTIKYSVYIGSSNGGQIDDLEFYIPIPKKNSTRDDTLIKTDVNDGFDLGLKNSVTIDGGEILLDVKYSFEDNLDYNSVKQVTTWYTEEQINSDDSLNWQDVTMLKVTLKEQVIKNGDSNTVTVNLKYTGNSYENQVGMTNKWASGGLHTYSINGRITSGNIFTKGVSVELKYNMDNTQEPITLTAAQNRTPVIEGNVNKITVDGFPVFEKEHTFTIKNIDTNYVTLQTKEYITNNAQNMSSLEANENFAITVKLNNNTEYDIKTGTNIGKSVANTAFNLTYELYNANALSENIQNRYIVVTLESDNGITIKQKININREISGVTEIEPAIMAGKTYIASPDTATEITITQNSAFTAQFSVEYVPEIYNNQLIIFSDALPLNTNMILVNMREDQNPTYWYYKVNTNSESSININQFDKMGTTSGNKYSKLIGTNTEKEKFIIIVDFSQCTNYLENKEHTINLKFEGQNENDYESTQLKFTTTNKRTFNMLANVEEIPFGSEFNVNYSLSEITGAETIYTGRKMAIVLTAPENLPLDSRIVVNNNNYYMNANKKFIIPLENVKTGTETLTMKIMSDTISNITQNYNINIELLVSSTANSLQPINGNKVAEDNITIKNTAKIEPALKITGLGKRLIHKEEVQDSNNITFNFKKESDFSVTMEVLKKSGNGYQKVQNVLSEVNGVTTQNEGVFNINATNGINNVSFSLGSNVEKGTYRIMLKVKNGEDILLKVPYNFIIIE